MSDDKNEHKNLATDTHIFNSIIIFAFENLFDFY